jgi:hypothetical protein
MIIKAVALSLTLFLASPSGAAVKTGPKDETGVYAVIAKEPLILEKPLTEIPKAEYLEDIEGFSGVAVYGNHLDLRPITDSSLRKYAGQWLAVASPEDGSLLGYIQKKGVEPVPDYEKSSARFYMVNDDSPPLSLQPGKGGEYSLAGYGFSLAKGEVVTSPGLRDEGGEKWLLLKFDTDYAGGSNGVGARYAWSPAEKFTDLNAHRPDNSHIDENLIPKKMRYHEGARTLGDGYDPDYKGSAGTRIDFLPVSGALRRSIVKRGFETGPAWKIDGQIFADEMADYYAFSGEYQADFITTDIFLHSFHLIFDHALQKLERAYLAPSLEIGLKTALGSLAKADKYFRSSGGNEEIYGAARDMLSIPLALLEERPGTETALSARAEGEVKRIMAAGGVEKSLVTGGQIDYTMFKPRGHYTLRPELERYFRAMSWLGGAELSLFDGKTPIFRNVAVTALISLALEDQGKAWSAFEAPVNFLVGVPNTGRPELFRTIAKKHFGGISEAAGKLSAEEAMSEFAADIKATAHSPMIQAAPGGDFGREDFGSRPPVFRISAKRFTYDAYIFNMLTSPRAGTDEKPRNLPAGTDVMAVLGSPAADELAARNDGVRNYAENMRKLKAGASKYLADDGTVYSAWIAALKAGFEDSGCDQFFYNSPAWQWKKLSTQSASWAELKHDTILYAEQSGAEMGDSGGYSADPFAPPYPRGYVEPDPQMFDALLAATEKLADFIRKFDMEPDSEDYQIEGRSYRSKLEEFAELLTTARDIAKKEAGGTAITMDDYMAIKQLSRSFNMSLLLPGENTSDKDQLRMALVADAASDYFDNRVLEIASGRPQRIYVFVNDASGGARITRGYIFSYYEFVRPLSDGRMTDEEWKKIVYDDRRADELKECHPDWYEGLWK